ncbi:hypothetical protein TL16_g10563 [Triparma laevis f. inornata]|uniref:WW domain-containing protein n=1 Tax=Triparma laevis f. inornata TaxID=1714386 RepID=A0A9W7EP90_9STRA|nr:hypothetical protein TL16_g10563 [Triparma laevis f. inornata]
MIDRVLERHGPPNPATVEKLMRSDNELEEYSRGRVYSVEENEDTGEAKLNGRLRLNTENSVKELAHKYKSNMYSGDMGGMAAYATMDSDTEEEEAYVSPTSGKIRKRPSRDEEWEERKTETGRVYFVDKKSGRTTLTEKELAKSLRGQALSDYDKIQAQIDAEAAAKWTEEWDTEKARPFWHNEATKEYTWVNPDADMFNDWEEKWDPQSQRHYWHNNRTRSSTWTSPFVESKIDQPPDRVDEQINEVDKRLLCYFFYEKHNPLKTSTLPDILEDYRDSEEVLMNSLLQKYRLEKAEWLDIIKTIKRNPNRAKAAMSLLGIPDPDQPVEPELVPDSDWVERWDTASQRPYWSNQKTGESSWVCPNPVSSWEEKYDAKTLKSYWESTKTKYDHLSARDKARQLKREKLWEGMTRQKRNTIVSSSGRRSRTFSEAASQRHSTGEQANDPLHSYFHQGHTAEHIPDLERPSAHKMKRMSLLYEGKERDVDNAPVKYDNRNLDFGEDGSLSFAKYASVAALPPPSPPPMSPQGDAGDSFTTDGFNESMNIDETPQKQNRNKDNMSLGAYFSAKKNPTLEAEFLEAPVPINPFEKLEEKLVERKNEYTRLRTILDNKTAKNAALLENLLFKIYKLNQAPQDEVHVNAVKDQGLVEKEGLEKFNAEGKVKKAGQTRSAIKQRRRFIRPRFFNEGKGLTKEQLERRINKYRGNGSWAGREPKGRGMSYFDNMESLDNIFSFEKRKRERLESDILSVDKSEIEHALEMGKKLYEEEFGEGSKYGKSLFLVETLQNADKAVSKAIKERLKAAKKREKEEREARIHQRDRLDSYYHATSPQHFENTTTKTWVEKKRGEDLVMLELAKKNQKYRSKVEQQQKEEEEERATTMSKKRPPPPPRPSAKSILKTPEQRGKKRNSVVWGAGLKDGVDSDAGEDLQGRSPARSEATS